MFPRTKRKIKLHIRIVLFTRTKIKLNVSPFLELSSVPPTTTYTHVDEVVGVDRYSLCGVCPQYSGNSPNQFPTEVILELILFLANHFTPCDLRDRQLWLWLPPCIVFTTHTSSSTLLPHMFLSPLHSKGGIYKVEGGAAAGAGLYQPGNQPSING